MVDQKMPTTQIQVMTLRAGRIFGEAIAAMPAVTPEAASRLERYHRAWRVLLADEEN